MQTTNIRSIHMEWIIQDAPWQLSIYKHPTASQRYEGKAVKEGKETLEFNIIRTSIGQWSLNGENIPEELHYQASVMIEIFTANNSPILQ